MSKEMAISHSPSKVDDWLDKSRPYMRSSEQPMSVSTDVPCGKHGNILLSRNFVKYSYKPCIMYFAVTKIACDVICEHLSSIFGQTVVNNHCTYCTCQSDSH